MASLTIFTTMIKELSLMQTRWASLLNPVLANPITSAHYLKSVPLVTGSNSINHMQGQALNGYLITGMHGAFAEIYDMPSPTPKLTLVLHASAPTSVDIAVY